MRKKLFLGIISIAMCAGMIFAQASNKPVRITCSKCGQSYSRAEGHVCPETPQSPHSPRKPNTRR